jgi:signal transduction histidine kinase
MGLILSKEIVKKYKGQMDFISEQDVGSTFVFTFEVDIPDTLEVSSPS